MYRHIMVPLDGSSLSEAAIAPALSVAEGQGARIHLVTVPDVALETTPYADWQDPVREDRGAAAYLERVAQRMRDDGASDVQTSLLQGAIAPALEEFAKTHEVDLIVMATHGRGSFSRLWLGSIADELVRHSPSVVLLVRPGPDGKEATDAPQSFRSVLLSLDGSAVAEAAVEPGLAVGREGRSRYTLLRSVPYPNEATSVYLPDTIQVTRETVQEATREAEEYLKRIATELRSRGLEVETHVVVESQPASAILRHAREHAVDLVAMATHGRGGLSRSLLGSTTDKVLRGIDKPVLICRPQ